MNWNELNRVFFLFFIEAMLFIFRWNFVKIFFFLMILMSRLFGKGWNWSEYFYWTIYVLNVAENENSNLCIKHFVWGNTEQESVIVRSRTQWKIINCRLNGFWVDWRTTNERNGNFQILVQLPIFEFIFLRTHLLFSYQFIRHIQFCSILR